MTVTVLYQNFYIVTAADGTTSIKRDFTYLDYVNCTDDRFKNISAYHALGPT
jgi:hypothetical protein